MAQPTSQKAASVTPHHGNSLNSLVGAWGFEPQTPTVSRQRSTTQNPRYNELFIIFLGLPDQLPDQFISVLCYCQFSTPSTHPRGGKSSITFYAFTKDLR